MNFLHLFRLYSIILYFIILIPNAFAAVVTHGGTLPDSAQKSDFYALIDSATITGIVNADVSSTAAIVASKLDLTAPGSIGSVTPGSGKFTTMTTTGNVGIGTNNVTVAALSVIGGNVGIGTWAPSGLLDVKGTLQDTYFTSNGNVGIGSLVPGQVLDVVGTVRSSYFVGTTLTPYVKVSETETSGTAGGQATTGSFVTRILNTTDIDTSGISSLSSNQVTLPAGTYECHIRSVLGATNNTQLRLQNITASTTLLTGHTEYHGGSSYYVPSELNGYFTLTVSSALAVQYRASSSLNTGDLGTAGSFGTEVYTTAEFIKVK